MYFQMFQCVVFGCKFTEVEIKEHHSPKPSLCADTPVSYLFHLTYHVGI